MKLVVAYLLSCRSLVTNLLPASSRNGLIRQDKWVANDPQTGSFISLQQVMKFFPGHSWVDLMLEKSLNHWPFTGPASSPVTNQAFIFLVVEAGHPEIRSAVTPGR